MSERQGVGITYTDRQTPGNMKLSAKFLGQWTQPGLKGPDWTQEGGKWGFFPGKTDPYQWRTCWEAQKHCSTAVSLVPEAPDPWVG
ncbi:hypothetical protein MC885_010167 [Smutsia gigantea]|nr:hypothetical protein MC885_010167 [Smutsia gigantea]